MKLIQSTAVLLAAFLLLESCATIVSKSAYPVAIDSSPEGAVVSITDKKGKEIYKGKTPADVSLKSGAGYFSRAEYQVKFSFKGHEEQVLPITFRLNGWYLGNLLIGGPLGLLVVDPASGAMWRIDNQSKRIYARLDPTATTSQAPTLQLMDLKDASAEMRSRLIRVK